jgi:mannose-6-phosphate isomerase-like protein (cupin superfamily)
MPPKPVQHLDDLEHYEQDSGPNITYQYLVRPGSMGLLSAGRVRLEGPTEKATAVHEGWDQVYLVLSGEGKVIVGDTVYPVGPGHVVRIPENTNHGVILDAGQQLEYCYFNAFRDEAAVRSLIQ